MTIEVTEQYLAETVDKVIAGMKAHGHVDSLDTASMVRERYRHLETWTFQPSVYGDRLAEVEGVKAEMMAALQAAIVRLEAEDRATEAARFPRQPKQMVISPSNQSPWVGRVAAEGDRFTVAQLFYMGKLGRTEAEPGECITVFRESTHREMIWSRGSPPPVFQFDCPVIGRRKDGKVQVIAPGGERKWVFDNGWVEQPSYLNRHLLDESAS